MLTYKRNDLVSALEQLEPIVSPRTTLPVLLCVKIAGSQIAATNLDDYATATVPTGGAVDAVLPFRQLRNLLMHATGEVKIERREDKVSIQLDSGKYEFRCIDPGDFPSTPKVEPKNTIALDEAQLWSAFNRTLFCSSRDESRYVLMSVFIEARDGALRLIATDGRRISVVDLGESTGTFAYIIPKRSAEILFSALSESGNRVVKFSFSDTWVQTEFGEIVYVSKLTQGVYPNWKQVIPAEWKHKISFDRDEAIAAVRRIDATQKENLSGVRLLPTGTLLGMASHDGEVNASEQIGYTGKCETRLTLRRDYLTEILERMPEDVSLHLNDRHDPLGFLSDEFTHVLMPMRTDD